MSVHHRYLCFTQLENKAKVSKIQLQVIPTIWGVWLSGKVKENDWKQQKDTGFASQLRPTLKK
jgi:hypothetical protein